MGGRSNSRVGVVQQCDHGCLMRPNIVLCAIDQDGDRKRRKEVEAAADHNAKPDDQHY